MHPPELSRTPLADRSGLALSPSPESRELEALKLRLLHPLVRRPPSRSELMAPDRVGGGETTCDRTQSLGRRLLRSRPCLRL